MKRTAGSGLQGVWLNRGSLLLQEATPLNQATASATWTVPQGQWWKPLSITSGVENLAAAAPTSVAVFFNLGNPAMTIAALETDLVAGLFDGVVTFAIGAASFTRNVVPFLASAPLPDIWLPPGSVIVLATGAPDGNADLAFPVLIALAAPNESIIGQPVE